MDSFRLPDDSLFLGLDSSTQSMKATILDSDLNIVQSELIHFDADLPHYNTNGGVHRDPREDGRVVSPTLMWIEALDLLLLKLFDSGLDFSKVAAISGSGQQHGSVYWKKGSRVILSSLDSTKSLLDQFSSAFSVSESPIWMDHSTSLQCREIEISVGGALELSKITGSRAYERFTGPQIRKLFQTRPDVYHNTERISLVSSFMASLFVGCYACIDHSDGAGMNLMHIKKRVWSNLALEATAPDLEEKLGNLAPAHAVAGNIASYFVERYGFRKDCLVVQWSGDNPNSLAGLTLSIAGDVAISLGTSDTIFGIADDPQPGLEGHVFPNPLDGNGYMVMLCYKNGSLTREEIRNCYAGGSWVVFNKLLDETPPLNCGRMGFYYKDHEILPPLSVGFHRFVLKGVLNDECEEEERAEEEVDEFDPPSEVRALVEGQLLSMRGHAERFGLPSPPRRIIATGGASANHSILKAMASIFGCDVYTVQRPDSASLGAALRAAHGWLCSKEGRFLPISSCLYQSERESRSLGCRISAKPENPQLVSDYAMLVSKRMAIENHLVQNFGRC